MKVRSLCVVAPGPEFSTYDVFTGMVQGLRETGCITRTFRLHNRLKYHGLCVDHLYETGQSARQISDAEKCLMAASDIYGDLFLNRPDAVLVVSGSLVPPEVINRIRERGIPCFVMLTELPYQEREAGEIARFYDGALLNDSVSMQAVNEGSGRPVCYLPHAYNPTVHYRPANVQERREIVIVGTGFQERIDLLEGVDWERIGVPLKLLGTWQRVRPDSPLRKYIVTDDTPSPCSVGGLVVIKNQAVRDLYAGAMVCVNIHRTTKEWRDDGREERIPPGGAYALNPRVFEVMACGGVLVTDVRAEAEELFGASRALTQFDGTAAGLEAAVGYLVAHPEVRAAKRATAVQAVAPYTYKAKAFGVLRFIEQVLSETEVRSGAENVCEL